MSDYRRAIYYLYNYENRHKRNNVGFTRVEQMNGKCKMISRIRVPSMNGKTLDVCLFIRDDNEIRFLPLGKMQIRNMTGEFRITLEENDIMEMGYHLKEMKGMVIYESMQKFFGSEWDDQPISFQEFKIVKEKNKREKQDTFLEYVSDKNQNVSIEEKEKFVIKTKKDKEILQTELLTASSMEEIGYQNYEEKPKDIIYKEEKVEKEKKEEREEKEKNEEKREKESALKQEEKEELNQEIISEALQENKTKKRVLEYHLPNIFYQFPQMNPFEDDEITDCVRIEPQDIGRLPMESWILANNSFLLHSYYSYRHLLLARRNYHSGFEYVLCAPGICQNREQFMAAMFGFCDFKPVKNVKDKNGEFGYWYMPVIIEN